MLKRNGWMRLAAVTMVAVSGVVLAPMGQMAAGGSAVSDATAQQTQPRDLIAEPEIVKVPGSERARFQRQFRNVQWTGAGFEGSTVIDRIPTRELRARLQKVFGDPSQKLKDLIGGSDFRPGHYIQFEYWFVVNDEIPMMVLDIDGPFGNGLVFAGDSRYVDLMPEIKRTLSGKLMGISELGEYEDHYFDINNDQWYLVSYNNGTFTNEKISRPRTLR